MRDQTGDLDENWRGGTPLEPLHNRVLYPPTRRLNRSLVSGFGGLIVAGLILKKEAQTKLPQTNST